MYFDEPIDDQWVVHRAPPILQDLDRFIVRESRAVRTV